MAAPTDTASYSVGQRWITQIDDHLYYDKKKIDGRYGKIIGAGALEDGVAIALADMLLLLDSQGNIVEQLRTLLQGLPRGINAIGGERGILAHGWRRPGVIVLAASGIGLWWRRREGEKQAQKNPQITAVIEAQERPN